MTNHTAPERIWLSKRMVDRWDQTPEGPPDAVWWVRESEVDALVAENERLEAEIKILEQRNKYRNEERINVLNLNAEQASKLARQDLKIKELEKALASVKGSQQTRTKE